MPFGTPDQLLIVVLLADWNLMIVNLSNFHHASASATKTPTSGLLVLPLHGECNRIKCRYVDVECGSAGRRRHVLIYVGVQMYVR